MTDDADRADTTDDTGPLTQAVQTVTPPYVGRPDAEMNTLGWGYVAVLVLLLFPFLPFVLLVWGTVRLIEALTGQD